jgi:hypothetical protein
LKTEKKRSFASSAELHWSVCARLAGIRVKQKAFFVINAATHYVKHRKEKRLFAPLRVRESM